MSGRKHHTKGWKQPFAQSMALCEYINRGNCTPEKVTEHWHRVFCCVAKYLGFNRATRRILWEELVAGNWSRLHLSYDEGLNTPDDWLQDFRWDVVYCSDRWSLDRLTRCHWLYRTYMKAVMEEVTDG